MKPQIKLCTLVIALVALGLSACGDDSGTESKNTQEVSMQVETQEDLPNCSKSREGDIAEVMEEKKAYVCDNGRWEFDHDILDSVKTENDLKACLSKNDGASVWVIEDEAIYVCTDRKWEMLEKEEPSDGDSIPTYKSEDDMPNCTKERQNKLAIAGENAQVCNDGSWQDLGKAYATEDSLPNCTKKRKDETAYIIEDNQALVCNGEKWEDNESAKEVVEEIEKGNEGKSSSSSGKSSGDKSSSSSKEKDPASSSSKGGKIESSDSKEETVGLDSIKDSRDNQYYKITKIGDQVWFAKNLNYNDKKSVCPMKEDKYCEKYGRLYRFFAGRGSSDTTISSVENVCPSGWHIPDSLDWEELFAYVKANNDGEAIGVSLKAKSGWYAEGDSVFIEGDGTIGLFGGSVDSTRVGATRGTNRFGFSALPAGSCWETGCYVDDDTRFVAKPYNSDRGGSFKLAFDKDDVLYDEDGYFGYISVRCLQNRVVKIDSMPPVIAIASLLWTAEDLTRNGSNQFTLRESEFACPSGWRLPTEKELQKVADANKLSLPFDKNLEFFVSDNFSHVASVNCRNYSNGAHCTVLQSSSTSSAIRCVNDAFTSSIAKLSCSASDYDKEDGSATWTISKDTEGSYKIAKYTWDFGEYTKDAKLSENKATLKFSGVTRITPTATVNGTIEHKGETYQMNLLLSCPTVMASSDSLLIFTRGSDNKLELYEGIKYNAYFNCGEGTYANGNAMFSCNTNGTGDHTVTINGSKKISGSFYFSDHIEDIVCPEATFTIEADADMSCWIQ